LWVARAFTKLGDDRNALDFYIAASRHNLRDVAALLGAGWAAFRLGRYHEALEYFKGASALHDDPSTSQMIELVTSVIELNPFESSIPATERRHRLVLAMGIADKRLRRCADAHDVDLDTVSGDPLQLTHSQWNYLNRQLRGTYNNSGLAVVCFRITIEFLRIELMGSSLTPSFPRILLAPAATGLVVAILVMFVFPRVRGSGVNQTKSALYVYDGYIPFRTAIGKFIC